MKTSTVEIIVAFAKLWGMKAADYAWSATAQMYLNERLVNEENFKEMESWDSEELLTLLTRWAVEYQAKCDANEAGDTVAFFENKLETLLTFAKLRRDTDES